MADKEATVYVIDVASSMGEASNGRDESDLDYSMKYIWDKITNTISRDRKTFGVGVVAFRTDGTNNELGDDAAYQHVTVLKPIGQALMPDLRMLQKHIKPSHTNAGDALSALVIAIQMITTFCKKLKYKRQITLVTNGTGAMDADDLRLITRKIQEDSIQLVILGVDFDDPDYGFKEEEKDKEKAANEAVLRSLISDCDGMFGTLQQAVAELGIPRLKTVRPVPSYKGWLSLGDPKQYDNVMTIQVERYPRTMRATAPAAQNFVIRSDLAPGEAKPEGDGTNGDADESNLAAVHQARTYQVKDEEAPGGKRDVERDDLAKGYEYGRTAVHISESDQNVTKLETVAGMDVIGFVPLERHDRYTDMTRTNVIIAQRTDDKAVMALSSFIHALFELDYCAIARLVTKDGKDPVLLLLTASIEPDFECLIDVELPFAEDVRSYKFPPLDRIVTVSGKVLTEHRNLPNPKLSRAMDDLVDGMNLCGFSQDEDGKDIAFAELGDTYEPRLHRLQQAIRHRAVHEDKPIPPPFEMIIKFMHPPREILNNSALSWKNVQNAADIKKVPPKTMSRKQFRGQQEQPKSGLDISSLLSDRNSANSNRVSSDNAIPEFKQILEVADSVEVILDATKQFGDIIIRWITDSLGSSKYDQAVEAIRIMKEECVSVEEPSAYNDFMLDLKSRLLKKELQGDRQEMWWKIRVSKLGLIEKKMSLSSNVSEEEARKFLSAGLD